ncbi:MAG: hypothetical protein R3314_01265 [Longimicrobiales bacterium]|nr:hypothetical protein [Longimicrobiales bacterium]
MALRDLLWACPECGADRGLVADGSEHRCRACGTRYARDRGARIRARRPDGSEIVRRPVEWLRMLPDPETIVTQGDTADHVIRSAHVQMARVTGFDTVRDGEGYLNRIELWGEDAPASLELRKDRLVVVPEEGGPESWPLESLTAVQASSSSLQINRRGEPLVSFRFADDSVFLWEELLHAALRDFYRRTGLGEILEFQPRIVTE